MTTHGAGRGARSHATRERRSRRSVAALLAFGLITSACGTTAYRDRIEIAAGENAAGLGGGVVASPQPSDSQALGTDTSTTTTDSSGGTVTGSGTSSSLGSSSTGSTSSGTTSSGTTSSGTTSSGTTNTAPSGTTGTTQPPAQGGSTPAATPSQGASPAPAASTPPASGGGNPAPPAAATRTEPDERGLTADTINVGFVKLGSFRALSSSLGFTASETGDVDGQINAVADWINANGGVAGRQIKVTIREYTQEEASPNAEAQICNALADDAEAWAVMLQGQIYQSTRKCYADKGVTTLDPSPFTFDDDTYASLSPFYWSPSYPSYDRVVRSLVPALNGMGYFEPMSSRGELTPDAVNVGVLHFNYESARRVLNDDMKPALAAIGINEVFTREVDGSNAGTIQAGLSDAITFFQANDVNRLMFIGGSPLAPFFYLNASNRGYTPRYGITTLDAPRHTSTQDTKTQMIDALGIGFNPVNDVLDEQHAFPSNNATEKLCLDIMGAAGHTFERRLNAQTGLAYCEALLMLDAAGDKTGVNLSHNTWAAAAEGLGSSYQSATALGTAFGPKKHDGSSVYRTITFDNAKMIFNYSSADQPFK